MIRLTPWLITNRSTQNLAAPAKSILISAGHFKLEFQEEAILSLCSKSYICVSTFGNKLAHKGVSAAQNPVRFENFKKVLNGATRIAATNKAIQVWNKPTTAYEQTNIGLASIYVKRKVCSDGLATTSLEL